MIALKTYQERVLDSLVEFFRLYSKDGQTAERREMRIRDAVRTGLCRNHNSGKTALKK